MAKLIICGLVFGPGIIFAAMSAASLWQGHSKMQCHFDRNELGPKGEHGQWYWEIYKCPDGTEHRELVASPRG